MKKSIVAFLVLAFLIPGLFIAIKIIAPSKQLTPDRSGEKPASEPVQKYQVISGQQLLPVDEASKNESFQKFRDELRTAVRNKDVSFLKQHIDDNIKYSFGADAGAEGFMREWNLDKDPEGSGFWVELEEVITLGGSFDSRGAFVAPYVFAKFPESVDAFVYAAVIEDKVKLYSGPDLKSEVIGLLDYNLVHVKELTEDGPWRQVSVTNDVEGYVQDKYLRSSVDYRAYFENKDGTWKMMFFVAGD